MSTTSDHVATVRLPRIHAYTDCRSWACCCWRNVWIAVSKAATATPARTMDTVAPCRPTVAPTT